MIRRKTVAASVALLHASPVIAADDDTQIAREHPRCRRAACAGEAESLSARPEVTVGGLDSRLKLAACDQPLETYNSPNGLNGGRGVVGVRCNGSKPWKIYVPVKIALMESVVVSRRPLVRGQALRADDLMLSEVDVSGMHKAYFTRIEDVGRPAQQARDRQRKNAACRAAGAGQMGQARQPGRNRCQQSAGCRSG